MFTYQDGYGNWYTNAPPSVATFQHCTIADNGSDGLYAMAWSAGGSGNATNCIFANNGGHGLLLDSQNHPGAFACSEAYNVFFNDDILVNGAAQALAATDSASDPLFWGAGAKPDPWYKLGSRGSPAYHSATDGGNRGAYQVEKYRTGTLIEVR